MFIHQVPRGTTFTFEFDDNGLEIDGMFDGNIDHICFNIICLEISKDIEQYQGKDPLVSFILGDTSYSFKANLMKISENKDAIHDSIEFKAISPIKDEPLRKNFRVKIDLRVRIHEYVDDFKKHYTNGWMCDAISDDISKRGIRLFSDYRLDAPLDTPFTLEFSLMTGSIYLIPATLKRSQPNTVTRSYAYDYGFIFDFKDMAEKQENLILEILEYKIRHRLK
ncbi:MAG: PilZ domain-containing protein [Defluviitaleaceae bacterium]|nr:PilZ domain-containing protein [Defluviitaleaceae bacterium]